jgi:hypothetical protein
MAKQWQSWDLREIKIWRSGRALSFSIIPPCFEERIEVRRSGLNELWKKLNCSEGGANTSKSCIFNLIIRNRKLLHCEFLSNCATFLRRPGHICYITSDRKRRYSGTNKSVLILDGIKSLHYKAL